MRPKDRGKPVVMLISVDTGGGCGRRILGDGSIMNKFIKGLGSALVVSVSALAFATSAQAAPMNFGDNYIGGTASNSSFDGQDVIGSDSGFNTTGAVVDRSGDDLVVRILTNYADNVGSLGTSLGALFIGDDTPAIQAVLGGTAASTANDTYVGNETRFNYALDFNTRPASSNSSSSLGGGATLFSLDGTGNDVELSSVNSGAFREDQAVRPDNAQSVGTGSWTLSGANKYVEFVIDDFFATTGSPIDSGTQNGFVFAWAMSCANDVIMGIVPAGSFANPVPLPAGFILLLSGLLGVGWLGRSRGKQATA